MSVPGSMMEVNTPESSSGHALASTPELMNISPMSGSQPTPQGTQTVLDELLKQRECLWSKKQQLTTRIRAISQKSSSVIDAMSEEELMKMYESLQEELLQKTVAIDSKELIIQGEHLNQTLLAVHNMADTDGDLEIQRQKRELNRLLEELGALSSQIGAAQKKKVKKETDLEKIRAENSECLQKSRELFSKIDAKKKEKEEELRALTVSKGVNYSLHDRLNSEIQMSSLTNNTLQCLILGSGINWAEDENLCKLMLEAGKPVSI
ncbi:hypothetical protein DPMN_115171 [Dreissena polymorpha]|uniref:Centromere protein H C-terminal domain-containing protein n=2 Tax=Dreissena polymorpha TaxID=45954 RepID=A0A9D4KLF7_DREPO|nr:hypothetical protein DPMN_115171 [Dreissena polymorpha]